MYDPGKGVHEIWRSQGLNAPHCYYHGIPMHSFEAYRDADKPNMPIILWFLTKETGHLHVAPLSLLTPYPSVDDKYPIINFPLTEMTKVTSFNTRLLKRYFDSPRSDRLPNNEQCKMLVDWLAQDEPIFEPLIEHLIDILETKGWAPLA